MSHLSTALLQIVGMGIGVGLVDEVVVSEDTEEEEVDDFRDELEDVVEEDVVGEDVVEDDNV